MSSVEELFLSHQGRLIDKWSNYLEIYDRHFSRFRGKEITLLEFGVYHGGSLELWRDYFGSRAKIVGVDINPECKKFADENTDILIGDQGDGQFLRSVTELVPKIDILIDDASHFVSHQILTFSILFPKISSDGIYLCEDNHISYWPEYGGKYRGRGSYIEFMKGLVDDLHGWHGRKNSPLRVTDFTRTAHSMHFYDSVVVIEKKPIDEPKRLRVGTAVLPERSFDQTFRQGMMSRLMRLTSWLR